MSSPPEKSDTCPYGDQTRGSQNLKGQHPLSAGGNRLAVFRTFSFVIKTNRHMIGVVH
jgi:hypothetical protein